MSAYTEKERTEAYWNAIQEKTPLTESYNFDEHVKLTTKTKLVYGIGEIGLFLFSSLQGFFLLDFLLEVAEIGPVEAGNVILVAQIWDGITDPLVGRWSDMTNSRWGRRRPWMLGGALPLAIFFWLLWQVPPFVGNSGLPYYYLAVLLVLNFSHTAVAVPYTALTADLTDDYDDRTSLTTYRFVFGLVAGIIGSFAHAKITAVFVGVGDLSEPKAYQRGYLLSASLFAPLLFITPLITFFFVRERFFKRGPEQMGVLSFFVGLKDTLSNKAYLVLLTIYFMAWVTINCVQTNLILWVKYVLKAEDQYAYLLGVVQVSAALFLFAIQYLTKKLGKKITYFIGMTVLIGDMIGMYFVQEGNLIAAYFGALFAGVGVATGMLIPWAMLPDVIDLDELNTGKRREGDMYSLFLLFQKIGLGGAMAASSYALEWAGYENPDESSEGPNEQPANVILLLRLLIGLIPASIIIVSLVVMFFYPISKQRHKDILDELSSRRQMML